MIPRLLSSCISREALQRSCSSKLSLALPLWLPLQTIFPTNSHSSTPWSLSSFLLRAAARYRSVSHIVARRPLSFPWKDVVSIAPQSKPYCKTRSTRPIPTRSPVVALDGVLAAEHIYPLSIPMLVSKNLFIARTEGLLHSTGCKTC